MSCVNLFVAKKFHSPGISPTAAQIAAIHSRLAAIQLTGLRLPSRVRKVASVRRRLPVTMTSQPAHAVKIRQILQNLGSPVSETRPVQSRHA
jgi:hypothetical protein